VIGGRLTTNHPHALCLLLAAHGLPRVAYELLTSSNDVRSHDETDLASSGVIAFSFLCGVIQGARKHELLSTKLSHQQGLEEGVYWRVIGVLERCWLPVGALSDAYWKQHHRTKG